MNPLPSLDAHAHLDPARGSRELAGSGAVLAMTLSLDEALRVIPRMEDPSAWGPVVWGVGCHPRMVKAQAAFDADCFVDLVGRTAVVGEVGLDTGSRVPLDRQLQIFRQILAIVSEQPRIVSIHSFRATGLVLDELRRQPVAALKAAPVLHWWTGSAAETRQAVELGCFFSIHSAVARHSKFHTAVPPERILVESDHGWADPPEAIPCRIEWVEHLVAQQVLRTREEVRLLCWQNLAHLVQQTGTFRLLPGTLVDILQEINPEVSFP